MTERRGLTASDRPWIMDRYWCIWCPYLVVYPCCTVGSRTSLRTYPVYPRWCTERACCTWNWHIYGLGRVEQG